MRSPPSVAPEMLLVPHRWLTHASQKTFWASLPFSFCLSFACVGQPNPLRRALVRDYPQPRHAVCFLQILLSNPSFLHSCEIPGRRRPCPGPHLDRLGHHPPGLLHWSAGLYFLSSPARRQALEWSALVPDCVAELHRGMLVSESPPAEKDCGHVCHRQERDHSPWPDPFPQRSGSICSIIAHQR